MASILERNKKVQPKKKTREDYAEDALYREVWEEVNNEKTQAFVKKYYRHLVAGALAILIAAVAVQIGVRTVREHRIARAVTYETALANVDANALAAIGENGAGATGDLALFQAYMLDGNIAHLDVLAARGATRDFRDLARLHIVSARGDDMSGADVEKYLSGLNTKSSPFYYTSRLIVAQKYLAEGNRDAANKWLDKIIGDPDAPAVVSANAELLK